MKNLFVAGLVASSALASVPDKFDLRTANGKKFVSAVKNQQGGTCWTHATAAVIESNLMVDGAWEAAGDSGEPNLAEYHLDWWNGFNRNFNADIAPKKAGLTVHEGGDYRVATAYLVRGDGMVRDSDGQSYNSPPKQTSNTYRAYLPHLVEWLSLDGTRDAKIAKIKDALMNGGAVGTALAWSTSLYSSSRKSFYQPPSSSEAPNHAVTIVGWDDAKTTQAPSPGAWLIKNSWGSSWGDRGYFWISYADKVAGVHPEMGAVSFRDTAVADHKRVYAYDYHGWRATADDVHQAFAAYTAQGNETIQSVGFYTTLDDTEFSIRVWRGFEGGELKMQAGQQDGYAAVAGWRRIPLNWPLEVRTGEKFYVEIELQKGGIAYDKTSDVPVLLCGPKTRTIVESKANAGETYVRSNNRWVDFTTREATGDVSIQAYAN